MKVRPAELRRRRKVCYTYSVSEDTRAGNEITAERYRLARNNETKRKTCQAVRSEEVYIC